MANVEDLRIRRASTADQVADALKAMILRGELAPGTPLPEVAVAESIGISRNTFRDAIRALARQGLVAHTMHRGAVVARLSEADVSDLFRVRRALEPQAVAASETATGDELLALAEAVRQLERAAEDHDWTWMVEADCLFHERLVGFLRSPRIAAFYSTIQGELRLCLSIIDRDDDDPAELVEEHRELRALIAGGERQRCAEVLSAHLADAEERLCRIVRALNEPVEAPG